MITGVPLVGRQQTDLGHQCTHERAQRLLAIDIIHLDNTQAIYQYEDIVIFIEHQQKV